MSLQSQACITLFFIHLPAQIALNTMFLTSLIAVIIISSISLIGVFTLAMQKRFLQKVVLYLVSFSAGAIFGDVFLHLIPELVEGHGWHLQTSLMVLAGIVSLFIVEKVLHWRHCHHDAEDAHCVEPFAYTNLVGDAVHNLVDGIIIGASFLISVPVGIATTIAVALHEIPQEIGDFGVLIHSGFSKQKALLMNFFVSLTAVVGVIMVFAFQATEEAAEFFVPFAIGNFIYIAGADLIPELHKETKFSRSVIQLLSFTLGIAIMGALLYIGGEMHTH